MLAAVYKCRSGFLLPGLLAVLILLSTCSAELSDLLHQRFVYCLEHLIPSLFGAMMTCNLMVSSGALEWFQRFMGRFGQNGTLIGIYLLSQMAGYPSGTILLNNMVQENKLSAAQAEKYACVCFGAGPAFLVGLAGAQLLGSAAAGWLLFACCALANLIVALMVLRGEWRHNVTPVYTDTDRFPVAVIKAAQQTMDSLWRIVATVLLFGIIWFVGEKVGLVSLLQKLGTMVGIPKAPLKAVMCAFADITGISEVYVAGVPYSILLPVLAALFSFGGLCVHCQCLSLGGTWISLGKFLLTRLITALLAAAICRLLFPLFPPPTVADVFSSQAALSKSGSLLPSFLIFCTGFPLFLKKDWTN